MMKKQLLLVFALLLGLTSFAQTTLVEYQFEGDLTPFNVEPTLQTAPTLKYYNSAGTEITPLYNAGRLQARNSSDYLEITIDTRGFSNITVSFDSFFRASGFVGAGTWTLSMSANNTPVYTFVDDITLVSFFGSNEDGTLSTLLSGSGDGNQNLKLRITASDFSFLSSPSLRLDNLKIVAGSPKILISSDVNTSIPHLSQASLALNTDFGTRQTSDPLLSRTFRVRNYLGSVNSQLNVTNITVTGANPGDFSVTPSALSNIGRSTSDSGNPYQTFDVRFLPLGDGIRTAQINVYSNSAPSPYIFTVIGTGASCSLTSSTFAINTMSPGQQTLESNYTLTSTDLMVGQGDNIPVNSLNTVLYPNPSVNLYLSSPSSWYVKGGSKEVEFGGSTGLDISGQKNVSIEFNVAAYTSSTNGTAPSNSANGLSSNSTLTLAVKKNGGSYINQITLRGSDANNRYYRYSFGSSSAAFSAYNSLRTNPQSYANSSAIKYGTFRLTIPAAELVNDLNFKISANTDGTDRLWLIDDVKVVTSNSVFKTFTTSNSWSPSPPTANEKAVIEGNYTNSGNPTICECEVAENGSLVIPGNTSLTVKGKVINNDGSNFIIKSDGNLIQVEDDALNSGNITAERVIKVGAARNQYNYLGTPVNFASGETFKTIYPGTTFVLYHNEANNMFYNSSGVNIPGRGLAVKEPTGSGATNVTATYKGVPQNGKIVLPVTNSNTTLTTLGYNLIGNPYPSNIDLLKLYDTNGGKTTAPKVASPNISATFYFWDNNGNFQFEQQGSGYMGQSYAIFNVLAGSNGSGTNAGSGSKVPTNIVKVGQGFMTRSLQSNYNLLFNNSIRTNATSAADFLGKEGSGVQDDRYWLTMTAPSGIISTIAIVHYPAGNNAFGPEDSRTMGGSDAIYSLVESEKIAINGRSTFADTDTVPLGTKHFAGGTFTVGLEEKEGIFANGQKIYLKDTQTGIITNLSEGNYTFQANAGESNGRFEILYEPETILATGSNVQENLTIYRDGSDFVVKSQSKKITNVEVFDANGRLILSQIPNNLKTVIPAEKMVSGVYVLKIDQNGQITSKKIIK